jgi:DNA-binding transcriptional ArsR family regulator
MDKDKKVSKTEQSAPWVIIPPTVLGDEHLSAGEKLVYGRVFGFIQKHGYCLASNEYLSKYIGMSKNTVRNYLSRLYELGYLRYELIRDESNEVVERRIYPTLVLPEVLPRTTPRTPESTKELKEENRKNVNVGEENAKADYFAELLAGALSDRKSMAYYRMVCRRHDGTRLLDKAKQIVADGGARKPAAVFAAWLKQERKAGGM